jgi:hypothetical protein
MLPALVEKGDPGIDRSIVIDGVVFSVMPKDMDVSPEPVSDYLDMLDGGAREFQRRPHFDGVPDYSDRYTFGFPYEALNNDDREKLELIRVRGGIHRLTLWRMVPVVWTCKTGVQRYYLPRFRKIAASVYDGLAIGGGVTVATDRFPSIASLNGAALTVTYADGPTLASPGAGGIVLARDPDLTGEATDYTGVYVGTAVESGDELILWACFAFEVSMRAPRMKLSGINESHAYTFVEV